MCLAVPAKIVEMSPTTRGKAVADLHGNRVTVSTQLVPDAAIGDWVLVHAGFAIQKLDAQAARETFAMLADIEQAAEETRNSNDESNPNVQMFK
ncbi:MAG: HypC/HybG/HupF family hydrogenase formation chaperone [Phycisphaerales bacterium]|nr:HypC/HybG/HupF family hydrogenase formation chaperone [Phycisphaerales bacterium]